MHLRFRELVIPSTPLIYPALKVDVHVHAMGIH